MKRLASAGCCIGVMIPLLWAGGMNAQNLIVNGSFEAPATSNYTTFPTGQLAIYPWLITMGSVDVVFTNNCCAVGPAFDGVQFLDLDGSERGQVRQSFATVPGASYELSFAYGNNYRNRGITATVRVFDSSGNRLGPDTITHNNSVPNDLHWVLYSNSFIASNEITTLEFTSLSPQAGSNGGILVDAVAVTVAAPRLSISGAMPWQVELSWSTNATGFDLEATSTLLPLSWSAVTNTPQVVAGRYVVTLEATLQHLFFRLNKP